MASDGYSAAFNKNLSEMGQWGGFSYLRVDSNFDLDMFITPGKYVLDSGTVKNNNFPLDTNSRCYLKVERNANAIRQSFYSYHVRFTRIALGAYNFTDSYWNVEVITTDANYVWDIYVSPDGNDKYTGFSTDCPIKTLPRAFSLASSLSSIVKVNIAPGEYPGFSDLSLPIWLRLTRWGNENPVITGNLIFKNMIVSIDNITCKTGFTFCGCTLYMENVTSRYISVQNCWARFGNLNFKQFDDTTSSCLNLISSDVNFGGALNLVEPMEFNCFFDIRQSEVVYGANARATGEQGTGARLLMENSNIFWHGQSQLKWFETLPGNVTRLQDNYFFGAYGHRMYGMWGESFRPTDDNAYSLGDGTTPLRWTHLYATDGTIQTSDEREKSNINSIPEEVFEAWANVNFVQFQFNSAVEEKGNAARTHTGVVAQRILEAFQAKNLDATKYGLLCHDSWEEKNWDETIIDQEAEIGTRVVVDQEGYTTPEGDVIPPVTHKETYEISPKKTHVEHHHTDGGDRYSIRYDECLCMEAAYQRWKNVKLEERLSAIEAKLS